MKVSTTVIATTYHQWGSRLQEPSDADKSLFYKGVDSFPSVAKAVKKMLEIMPELAPCNFFPDVDRWHKTFSYSNPMTGIGYYYFMTDDDRCVELFILCTESVPKKRTSKK